MPLPDRTIRVRSAAPGDVETLAATMRHADREEFIASHGPALRYNLHSAVALSSHGIAIDDNAGNLVCLMGVMPIGLVTGTGAPWMLGSDALVPLGRTLGLVARRYFAEVARAYPVLTNYVDVRNTASVRLLHWLGCSFDEPAPYGWAALPFMRFEKRGG